MLYLRNGYNMEKLLINKEVDWSLLKDGFSIPVALQPAFYALTGEALTRSQSKVVTLIDRKSVV